MRKRTIQQNKILHSIFYEHKILGDDKDVLIAQFTDNRTIKSSEMMEHEAAALIDAFKQPHYVVMDRMRKSIIAKAHEMAWELHDGRIDMERVNNWCAKFGYIKKECLNDYNYAELQKLVTQFDKVYKSFLKDV